MDTKDPTFGELLLKALLELDRNQTWLATQIEVSDSSVSRWISGETRPSVIHVHRIADHLGFHGKNRDRLLRSVGYGGSGIDVVSQESVATESLSLATANNLRYPSMSLPPKHFRRLVGRHEQLDMLLAVLRDPQHQPIIAIVGLGGIGKTALAREVVEQVQAEHQFEYIVWSTAKTEHLHGETIKQENLPGYTYDTLLGDIARQCSNVELTHIDPGAQEAAIGQFLKTHQVLIVLDNLDTATNAATLVDRIAPHLGISKLLITSRHHILYDKLFTLTLRGLSEGEAVQFLLDESRYRNIVSVIEGEPTALQSIYTITGGAPLAMRLVTGQMLIQPMQEVLTVLKRADFNAQDYPFYKFVYYHSWQLLELPGRKALVDISVFPPLVGGSINDVQNVSQVPASEFGSAMQTLVSMSLVDKIGKIEQERLALHPLTQYFIRSNITREWQET